MSLLSNTPLNAKHGNPVLKNIWASIAAKLSLYIATSRQCARKWRERSRQRRALAQLSSYQLKDIGVSRSDAINEASKPFWKS